MPTPFHEYEDGDLITSEDLNAVRGAVNALELGSTWCWATGGTGDAYTLTPVPALDTYEDGNLFFLVIDRAYTGPVTLNVSGLGPKSIRKQSGNELSAGDLVVGAVVLVVFSGLWFHALSGLQALRSVASGSAMTVSVSTTAIQLLAISGQNKSVGFSQIVSLVAGQRYAVQGWQDSGIGIDMMDELCYVSAEFMGA